MDPVTTYVGLGSNLENPPAQILQACNAISRHAKIDFETLSPLYISRAIGPAGQPDYVNAVVKLRTALNPLELLEALQEIERQQRRVRLQHWGPRTIDLDILLYGSCGINTPRLTVPHPYIEQRNFVLAPLADVAPDLKLPNGKAVKNLLMHVGMANLWRTSAAETRDPL